MIGIRLKKGDEVVSLAVVPEAEKDSAQLLSVTESGLGKRTPLKEFPVQNRGGQGVIGHRLTERTGAMVSLNKVLGSEELFVLAEGSQLIRTAVDQVSVYGRASQGVTIKKLDDGDRVVAAMVLPSDTDLAEEE